MLEVKAANPESSRMPLTAGEPTTLIEMYEQVIRDHPKPGVLSVEREGVCQSLSAEEMLDRARHLAAGLHPLRVRKGDRVAVLSDGRLEEVLIVQGCVFLL